MGICLPLLVWHGIRSWGQIQVSVGQLKDFSSLINLYKVRDQVGNARCLGLHNGELCAKRRETVTILVPSARA